MKQKIPLMYLFVHKRLKEKSLKGIVPKKNFYEVITRLNHINKRYVPKVLEEFKILKLIEPINKNELKILKCKVKWELI